MEENILKKIGQDIKTNKNVINFTKHEKFYLQKNFSEIIKKINADVAYNKFLSIERQHKSTKVKGLREDLSHLQKRINYCSEENSKLKKEFSKICRENDKANYLI